MIFSSSCFTHSPFLPGVSGRRWLFRNRYLDKFVTEVVEVARRLRPLPDRPIEEVRETFATKLELSMRLAISKYKPIQVTQPRSTNPFGLVTMCKHAHGLVTKDRPILVGQKRCKLFATVAT